VQKRTYWLKSVGSADDQMVEDWVTSAPQELSHFHFSAKGKPHVRVGDYLIYYAPGRCPRRKIAPRNAGPGAAGSSHTSCSRPSRERPPLMC
jgi:hypothetical protein